MKIVAIRSSLLFLQLHLIFSLNVVPVSRPKPLLNTKIIEEKGLKLLELIDQLECKSNRTLSKNYIRDSLIEASKNPNSATPWQWAKIGASCTRHFDKEVVERMVQTSLAADAMNGKRPSVPHLTRVVDAASKAEKWDIVEELLDTMYKVGAPPNLVTYCAVFSSMGKVGEHSRISTLIERVGSRLEISAWNAIMSGVAGAAAAKGRKSRTLVGSRDDDESFLDIGSYETCMKYFDMMTESGLKPNCMTFSNLIAVARDGPTDPITTAENILRDMQVRWKVKPDVYCLNNLMALYMTNGQPQKALDLLRHVLEKDKQQKTKVKGEWDEARPDLITYNTGISACERLSDGKSALMILNCIQNDGNVKPDKITFNSGISALGKGKMCEEALNLFKEMNNAGTQLDIVPDTTTFNAIISACARGGQYTIALVIFEAMETKNICKDEVTYGAALHACMRGALGAKAEAIIQKMERENTRISPSSYASAIFACLKSDRTKEALEIYKKASKKGAAPVGKAEKELSMDAKILA
eukprot:CAMPEP_0171460102 /NCGR_PEP_ID=MMETSP0945-20130129/5104_1 /TAXON_ID=109269 /ORGANISM="Vaucheria litorea, Strain CCMP2940" /LENGTH=526 /DNA_ID=CAMNT_0011986221 /DNA_START=23 /DNA_END=1604 /DNA_ORIENTATION=-